MNTNVLWIPERISNVRGIQGLKFLQKTSSEKRQAAKGTLSVSSIRIKMNT